MHTAVAGWGQASSQHVDFHGLRELASHFHSSHRFIPELREEAIKAQTFEKGEEISLFFPSQRME